MYCSQSISTDAKSQIALQEIQAVTADKQVYYQSSLEPTPKIAREFLTIRKYDLEMKTEKLINSFQGLVC